MKKSIKLILTALAVYAALLLLLLAAEAQAPDAAIDSLGDAVWFSLITMTTVGYGDLSPVTALGRVVGAVFALSSIGILTALIGLGFQLLSRTIIPRMRLRLAKGSRWYAFLGESEEAAALAQSLREEEPECMLIFPEKGAGIEGSHSVPLNYSPKTLLRLRGSADGLALFAMGSDPWENYRQALSGAAEGIQSYCMADLSLDHIPPDLKLFSPHEVVSRCYWKEHPLSRQEKSIVLIGCGEAGCALLERALLTNVFEKGRSTAYHIFGSSGTFEAMHPEILNVLGMTESEARKPDDDTLCFHRGSWAEARTLLETADRILICGDHDSENHGIFDLLCKWFAITGKVHVLLKDAVPGLESFGNLDECYTPEYVMKDEVNRQAILLNDIYNEEAEHPTAWQDLSAFLKQSNVAAADHLIIKARFLLKDESITALTDEICCRAYARFVELREEQAGMLQEMEHRRWMRFYQMYNWRYAPVRDNARRRHPQMKPYEELDAENQKKDLYAWEMLGRLAQRG